MSDPASEMEWQLRKLMELPVGEPTRQITIDVVRHLARRRTIAAVAAALAILLIGGAGAAVAARTGGRPQVSTSGLPSGVPRYYYQQSQTSAPFDVTRATADGAITATVHCPKHGGPMTIESAAPVGLHTFFILCKRPSAGQSRIYGFRLTTSGRITRYFPVRDGALGALNADGLTVTPDGSRVAVFVPAGRSSPAKILVIDTGTGTGTVWLWPKKIVGKVFFVLGEALFKMKTGNGFSYRFFSADPFRRHFILDAGPASGLKNGWVDRGHLVPLKPTAGDNVGNELW